MINERTLRDCVPYDERQRSAYDLLREARELLGRAHDKVATACMDYPGEHQVYLIGVCPQINEVIEKLNDACGVAD